ncbi:putative tRNA(His) guanylyltransferase [Orchesella cincta]|uniref:Probable tRNA(His) guanylyltransferase n=1 Tax=Orchesella cincta TaxID=48709 RepID=A0A1D2N1Q3_ORCCI|nr:putative tRNA(His) guanylyltransferase [Orchesella cincta]
MIPDPLVSIKINPGVLELAVPSDFVRLAYPGSLYYFKIVNDGEYDYLLIDYTKPLSEEDADDYYKCVVTEDLTGKEVKLLYGATKSVDGHIFCLVQFEGYSYVEIIPPENLFKKYPTFRRYFEFKLKAPQNIRGRKLLLYVCMCIFVCKQDTQNRDILVLSSHNGLKTFENKTFLQTKFKRLNELVTRKLKSPSSPPTSFFLGTPTFFHSSSAMANSKWDYVKKFELDDTLLPNCFAIARIDGRGFHRLAKKHNWTRPNDLRALKLMNKAAKCVMEDFDDAVLGYGQSDEYSFLFRREAEVFQRRSAKIITNLVSKFSSAFVYYWPTYFPDVKLQYPPSFDGRIVLYPTDRNLRDYLCWRQADCHINNLYNTTFWALVQQGGMNNNDAQQRLSGTLSGDKHEILFSQFGINYNNEPEIYRKGTVMVKKARPPKISRKAYIKLKQERENSGEDEEDVIMEMYCDIIGDKFWVDYPHLLGNSNDSPADKSKSKEKADNPTDDDRQSKQTV